MTDIEIPDNEEAACDLDKIEAHFVSRGRYPDAEFVAGAARRLRADAEEIARLEAKCAEQQRALEWYSVGHCEKHEARIAELEAALATANTEAAAQRELATLLERESTDPLTRIAAALDKSVSGQRRYEIARDALVRLWTLSHVTRLEDAVKEAVQVADALLAEMGEK